MAVEVADEGLNKAAALRPRKDAHLGLAVMESELKTVVAAGRAPADLTIKYDDMHGLWGGATITVRGDGCLIRQTRMTGEPQAQVERKTVAAHELIELVRLLVEVRAWEQLVPESQPVAGESRAYLNITLGGSSSGVWERVNEMRANDRLLRVKNYLMAL